MTNILKGAEDFVANINRGLAGARIHLSELDELDHLCYRTETMDRYNQVRRELMHASRLFTPVGEPSMINGRPIATFQMREPLQVEGWQVSYLELPAPKDGSPYPEGLEHAEFVVLGGDLQRFRANHPDLEPFFSLGGMDKSINPELGLKEFDMSVKFHELPLGKVVRIEQEL